MDITTLSQRQRQRLLLLLMSCVAVAAHDDGGAATKLKSLAAPPKLEPTYYWSNGRGSYKYAYDGGDGISGAQSANEANEVSGHYTYYEKNGTPVTVKYTAGVHGFQAEVLPGIVQASHAPLPPPPPPPLQHTAPVLIQPHVHPQTTVATAVLPYGHVTTAATAATAALMGVNTDAGNSAATASAVHVPLNFVNNVMKRIHTQPLQISFSTQQMHVQQHQQQHQHQHQYHHHDQQQLQQHQHQQAYQQHHSQTLAVATKSSLHTNSPPPAAVTKADMHQINTLSTADGSSGQAAEQHAQAHADSQWPKRPYAFAYESSQSAHSAAADAQGNVIGKYSYCDEAGYHDLAYKAGDNIGFQILGGNLAKSTQATHDEAAGIAATATAGHHVPLLVVNVAQEPNVNYSYKLEQLPDPHNGNAAAVARNGRSLRKFRRFANW